MAVFKHLTALVETEKIGDETRIWAYTHILPGAVIGRNCNVCDFCFIEGDVIIGDDVTIKSGIYLWNGLRIEDKVFLGPNVVLTNDLRPRSKAYPDSFLQTTIKYGASVGANSTIIAGNTIGKWAMIGAGSVITKDIPNYALAYGNPARVTGYVCSCGEKLAFTANMALCSCGERYQIVDGRVISVYK